MDTERKRKNNTHLDWQDHACAILSGLIGHWLEARGNPLAVDMQLLSSGGNLSSCPRALAETIESPQSTLIVLIHGLTELESIWDFPGRPGDNYATRLAGPLEATPLYLRYNTGRAIPDNGRDLAGELEAVCRAWPRPVERLILVGHSMGGLLIRSACHQGRQADHDWVGAVDSCLYIGSPHDGSWLARAADGAAGTLNRMPRDYLRAIGEFLDLRSPGIRDLTRGEITERDTEVAPLLPSAKHYAVSGLVSRRRTSPLNTLVGDALVHEDSAAGALHAGWSLSGHACFPGIHHLRLAHHPKVHRQIREWLQ